MNPAQDALYGIRTFQAASRGQSAGPHAEFYARLPETCDADLSGLTFPPPGLMVQIKVTRKPIFTLGLLYITPNAARSVPADEVFKALARHAAADWGTLDQHDWGENDKAIGNGGRVFSAYQARRGIRFYVITESDRSTTTVLLPEDY
jgi:hypothetical protein